MVISSTTSTKGPATTTAPSQQSPRSMQPVGSTTTTWQPCSPWSPPSRCPQHSAQTKPSSCWRSAGWRSRRRGCNRPASAAAPVKERRRRQQRTAAVQQQTDAAVQRQAAASWPHCKQPAKQTQQTQLGMTDRHVSAMFVFLLFAVLCCRHHWPAKAAAVWPCCAALGCNGQQRSRAGHAAAAARRCVWFHGPEPSCLLRGSCVHGSVAASRGDGRLHCLVAVQPTG